MDNSKEKLIEMARQAAQKAYSNFPVGAVVETEEGNFFSGCNVSNASSGLGVCAERIAIFKAVSEGYKKIKKVAVTCLEGDPKDPGTLMPCGACLQVMAEFMSPDSEIIVDKVGVFKLKDLIPLPFKFDRNI